MRPLSPDNGQYSGQKFVSLPPSENQVEAYFCPVFTTFFSLGILASAKYFYEDVHHVK